MDDHSHGDAEGDYHNQHRHRDLRGRDNHDNDHIHSTAAAVVINSDN